MRKISSQLLESLFILSVFSILSFLVSCNSKEEKKYTGWEVAKGSPENIHYSSLTQIDTSNVSKLQLAWEYHAGDSDNVNHSQIQCNPIIVKGVLYAVSPKLKLFAIDAATGKMKWEFNAIDSLKGNKKSFFGMNNVRGVSYWSDGKEDERIYYGAGSDLYAIDAKTGKPITSFATQGKLDLHTGLDRDVSKLFVTATSPPMMVDDMLIIGSRVDEGSPAAPGHIRAFDVRTGERRWIFHTIPQPGEEGYESWENKDAYKFTGGANAWSGFSLDKKRGILFAATGSASYDFYGGKRKGNNLFGNCVIALDAKTGKKIWHFQTVHHDIWDRDHSSPPALVTVTKDGKKVDAVAVTTKSGFIFLFERETGKPVYEIVEKPVPTDSDLEGEQLSATQPYPTLPVPFMRQTFTEEDINPLLPDSSFQEVKKRLQGYRYGNMFTPISTKGTIVFPGLDGGGEWGGPSFDPETGILYVNANQMAWVIQAVDVRNKSVEAENYLQAGQRLFQSICMSCHGQDRKGSGNYPTLIGVEKKYTAASFDTLIQTGRRMMPAFKQIEEQDRKAIASFVLNQVALQKTPYINTGAKADTNTKQPYSIVGYNKFLSKEGLPAITPPWGTLNAIDLSTGQYVWKKTLGTDPNITNSKEPTGSENYGASVITAGGILFIGATKDGKFRAFNKRTGDLLWETDLPAPAFSTPSVYEVDGKQFVVIACGGGKMNSKSSDSYVAFALP